MHSGWIISKNYNVICCYISLSLTNRKIIPWRREVYVVESSDRKLAFSKRVSNKWWLFEKPCYKETINYTINYTMNYIEKPYFWTYFTVENVSKKLIPWTAETWFAKLLSFRASICLPLRLTEQSDWQIAVNYHHRICATMIVWW